MLKKIGLIALVLILMLTGCAKRHTSVTLDAPGMLFDYDGGMESAFMPEFSDPVSKSVPAAYQDSQSMERMIVRRADLSIKVMDTNHAIEEMGRIAVQFGGFLVSSNTYQRTSSYSYSSESTDNMPYGEAMIRVKAENFDQAIKLIEELTPDIRKYVTSKVISGEDITSDFVDTSARLTSLEKTVSKLYEIMDKATKTEDILKVYNQIAEKESEIEMLKGQLKYMQESAALSAISVQIAPIEPVGKIEVKEWSFMHIVRQAIQQLIDSAQIIGEILIYFVISVLPFLLIVLIPFILILRWLIRKLSQSSAKNPDDTKK